ncbi:MAG: type II toxin-antitoxin system PemK/MazF family toxin [Defluviicoccus sp.]|nr:type II toxin-antitoxin system PemK/MazF family toxin [Defluviicoccus sp.]
MRRRRPVRRRPGLDGCEARGQRAVVVKRGDIWLVSLDPSAGHEQRGTRPVLIVSPEAFNALTGTPVVLPITTGGNFARRRGFAVSLDGAGTRTRGVIRCDRPRALDVRARRGRHVDTVPGHIVDDVLARLATLLG